MAKPPSKKIIEIKPVVEPGAKVYPRSISGPYTRWRWASVWLTQIVFYGLCWLPWHGRQAILFDIDTRKFYFLRPRPLAAGHDLSGVADDPGGLRPVPVHGDCRTAVVRLHLPANRLHGNFPLV
jgi:hypothetical protein